LPVATISWNAKGWVLGKDAMGFVAATAVDDEADEVADDVVDDDDDFDDFVKGFVV
jgi:hypothetical protein